MHINLASIDNKVEEYAKSKDGKKKIAGTLQKMKEDEIEETAGGSLIISKKKMDEVSDELIRELQASAHSAGFADSAKSVLGHFDKLIKSDLIENKDGSCRYEIMFEGKTDGNDSSLARDPLDEDYVEDEDRLKNIVALFNNGYTPGRPRAHAYGTWYGHKPTTLDIAYRTGGYDSNDSWMISTLDRPAMHFMQRAVDDFNAKYEKKYGIRAVLSEEYTNPNYYD